MRELKNVLKMCIVYSTGVNQKEVCAKSFIAITLVLYYLPVS